VRGIAAFDDVDAAAALVSAYKGLDAPTKTEALNTLASRAAFARLLKDAVESNAIPRDDLTAAVLRQLHSLNDETINDWIGSALGMVRRSPQEKLAEMQRWRDLLHPAALDGADPMRGRAVFARACMQCHTLFDAGGKTGPDLTGSDRANVNYILENVIDPSAVVGKQYLTTVVAMKDGRVLAGVAKAQDESAVTLQTETETLVLPRPQIQRIKTTELSMMPEGLLAGFQEDEVRDLVAYLRSPKQVPMLATPQNANGLFNSKDLTGWSGDHALWSVENGQIVGRTSGLERNAFLVSTLVAENFKLTLEVKLVNDEGNSGIQFRSEPIDGGADVKGYQADVGPGWWGKLYEEHGRGVISDRSGESFIKRGEWNRYEIVAVGSRIRTKINGQLCAELEDPTGDKRGIFALQLHSGGPTEVRFRNLKLEVDPLDKP
jgi:putative heme-binding domain-containing protein